MFRDIHHPGDTSATTKVWCTHDVVRTVYKGLLGREPKQEEEKIYDGDSSERTELSSLLGTILCSEEFWTHMIAVRAPELVQAAYRGLLGREPDSQGLTNHISALSQKKRLAGFLYDFTQSDEFWYKTLASRASNMVRDIYRGLLGREPDQDGLDVHTAALARNRRLDVFLTEFISSDEYWDRLLAKRAPDILQAIYKGLFGKELDDNKLQEHAQVIRRSRDLAVIVAALVRSEVTSTDGLQLNKCPDPALRYHNPCFVFLHIPKTAGTSVQHHLEDTFDNHKLYREHSDNLYRFSPGELSRYDVFAGHFNYDSLQYIPRKKLSVFTFLREPRKRLISLYHFWRAHEPDHPNFHEGMEIANRKMMADFFEDEFIRNEFAIWNRIVWAIMGDRQWQAWHTTITREKDPVRTREIINDEIRPAIIKRINEFIYIGIAEDFENSVKLLFTILGKPVPDTVRADHFLDQLLGNTPYFKNTIDKQQVTTGINSSLDDLVQLDSIIYEEALRLHSAKLSGRTG